MSDEELPPDEDPVSEPEPEPEPEPEAKKRPRKPASEPEPVEAAAPGLGDRGELIRSAQRMLNRRGAGIAIDGIFSSRMLAALRSFQSSAGIDQSGVLDPETIAALEAD